uniref:Uncharacterized protein n=1 Tax=Globisporangium ultimum (strain ATCC 200006 / CBS 805.95 / DAOM BR144) TaxID=431595 RepID=K3X2W4_GLOUD
MVLANISAALGRSAQKKRHDEEMVRPGVVTRGPRADGDLRSGGTQRRNLCIIYSAFSCKNLEEIRKDDFVMMSHHVTS